MISPDNGGPDNGGPDNGGSQTTNYAISSLGVASALCGPVVAIIAIFDLDVEAKISWSAALTLAAFLVGAALFAWLRTRRRLFGITLLVSILAYPLLVVGALATYQEAINQTKHSCFAPGEGSGSYGAAFREAFARAGGAAIMGCATSPVVAIGSGAHQNFAAPDGRQAVIFSAEPGRAVALNPDDWIGYHTVRGPVDTTAYAGFPSDPLKLASGEVIEIGGVPGDKPLTAVVRQGDGPWYWVQQGMWPCYKTNFGGPEGLLGYPIGPQEYDEQYMLPFQRFEHGSLYYDDHRGVLTEMELKTTKEASCETPAIRPPVVDVYRIESNPGGVPHEILPGGHVDQEFTAINSNIDDASVVVGLDPRSDTGGTHTLGFELMLDDKLVASNTGIVLVNNGRTGLLRSTVQVVPGKRYTLRVTNASQDVLGFYLNSADSPGSVGSNGCRAHLVGEKPQPRPHDTTECLAALVRGH